MPLAFRSARIPSRTGVVCALLFALLGASSHAQTKPQNPQEPILQRRYEAAQHFQARNDFPHAAEQYRIFIADALGQLGIGEVQANQYEKAADNFDEALRLVPDFPTLQLEYARASLRSGNLQHAKLLATAIVQSGHGGGKILAGAHVVMGRVLLKLNKVGDAKKEFEAAVALDPSFENGYELAVSDLDLGDQAAAAQIFREMVASFGDTAVIHMYFGQAYGTSDFQSDSVREFKEAIAKDKQLPGVHYSLASAYLSTAGSSMLTEAEGELRTEITVAPKNAAAYTALGHLLANQHRGDATDREAEQDLKQATELDPANPDAYLYLGQFYADAKKPLDAETALRQSIAHTTDLSRNAYQVQKAHYLLGRLLLQTGQIDEGKKELAAAQGLMQANLSQDQNRLSDYLGDTKAAATTPTGPAMPMDVEEKAVDPEAARKVDAYEKQMGPAIADSYNNLGAIAGSEGDFRGALLDFKRTAEWNPTMPGLDYNWGRAAFQAGDFALASQLLSRCLQENSGREDVRASLGISEFMMQDYPAAKSTLQPLDDKPGESPNVRYAYADSLLFTGDLHGGLTRLIALEKADPSVPEVHRSLGQAYAAQNATAAAAEFETAIRLNPKDAESHEALARLDLSRGDAKAAVQNLQAALKLQPGNAQWAQELSAADHKITHP